MTTFDIPATITAIGALVTAVGIILIAWWAYRAKERAALAAEKAAMGAEAATKAADAAQKAAAIAHSTAEQLVVVKGEVRVVGDRIDGRLTELLAAAVGLARAEGVAQGEQAQRDRAAPPDAT